MSNSLPTCPVCHHKRERGGWCLDCQELWQDIKAAHAEPDDRGDHDTEAFDIARRIELHRGRQRPLTLYRRRRQRGGLPQ